MGWVRYELDAQNLLRRQTSQANCRSNPGSWYHDGLNTLYVNPIDAWDMSGDSDTAIEYVQRNTLEGIYIPDGCYGIRVENIRIDGYGCSPVIDQSYAGYGLHAEVSGTGNVLVIGVEAYYNNRHSIGITSPSTGGIMTCIDCKYGAVTEGSEMISYSTIGGENAEIFSPQYQNSGATKSELTETKIENGIIYLTGYGLNCTQNELEPCLSKNWQKLKTVKFKIEGDKLFEIK
jgi:hypothetical protein